MLEDMEEVQAQANLVLEVANKHSFFFMFYFLYIFNFVWVCCARL